MDIGENDDDDDDDVVFPPPDESRADNDLDLSRSFYGEDTLQSIMFRSARDGPMEVNPISRFSI